MVGLGAQRPARPLPQSLMPRNLVLIACGLVLLGSVPRRAHGQARAWRLLHANEVQTPLTTIRIGGGFLTEIAAYEPNAESQEQIAFMRGGTTAPVDTGESGTVDVAR